MSSVSSRVWGKDTDDDVRQQQHILDWDNACGWNPSCFMTWIGSEKGVCLSSKGEWTFYRILGFSKVSTDDTTDWNWMQRHYGRHIKMSGK
jgi:hypothetical protein